MSKYNYEQIALDLLLLPTDLEISKKNNISISTLYRIKRNDEFKKILELQKERIFKESMAKSQAYCLQSLEILMDIAKNEETPPNTRVSACSKIIDIGQTAFDQEVIIKRMEQLEQRLISLNE